MSYKAFYVCDKCGGEMPEARAFPFEMKVGGGGNTVSIDLCTRCEQQLTCADLRTMVVMEGERLAARQKKPMQPMAELLAKRKREPGHG